MTMPTMRGGSRTILLLLSLVLGIVAQGMADPAQAKLFDAESFTLPNGLQVVVIPNHRAPIVTQMVWYKAGAADEVFGVSGAAHFLEHLMFRGTKTVAPGDFSRIVAQNGGEENAFTTHDYTAFYQDVAADRLDLVMKLEADRMANLVINDAVVKPEREVIIEERRMRIDNVPSALFDEQLDTALYLDHPYRIPTIGWENEMHKLTAKDEQDFYKKWYAPNNAVLVIAGDATVDQVKALATKYFGPIPSRPVPVRQRVQEPAKVASARLIMKSPRVTEINWSRQWLAPSYNRGDTSEAYPLQVLAEVLGGSAASPLYKGLVIDKGLALSAGAYYDPNQYDLATFGFSATLKHGVTVADFETALDGIVKNALDGGITAEEVERAKQRMVAAAVYARDSLSGPARIVGTALALGRSLDDVQAWPDKVAAVTPDQVREAAKAVIKDDIAVTGVLMPGPTS
ncbi:MAG TPA: pitrilysin family protein [Stellaceae bacterium]|jgi:zinc protease|nr:pitrilysin family protein [Stellaceae bacterium]